MAKPGPISAKPLSLLLSDVFSDAYARQGFAARELVTRWAEIAGAEIATHCEPLKLQWPRPVEGQPQDPATLVLRVEGPMALEIQHASDVPEQSEVEEVARTLSSIEDEALRAALARLGASIKRN